jgi:hypothetical protein
MFPDDINPYAIITTVDGSWSTCCNESQDPDQMLLEDSVIGSCKTLFASGHPHAFSVLDNMRGFYTRPVKAAHITL